MSSFRIGRVWFAGVLLVLLFAAAAGWAKGGPARVTDGASWSPSVPLEHAPSCDRQLNHRQLVVTSPGQDYRLQVETPTGLKVKTARLLYVVDEGAPLSVRSTGKVGRVHTFMISSHELREGTVVSYAFVFEGRSENGACSRIAAAVAPSSRAFQTLVTREPSFNGRLFEVSMRALLPYITPHQTITGLETEVRQACQRYFAEPTPCTLFDRGSIGTGSTKVLTQARHGELPRLIRVTDEVAPAAATRSCTFQSSQWWWRTYSLPVQHTGLVTANISYAMPMQHVNAVKQYTFAAVAFRPASFSAMAQSRVGFAVGFQIGSGGGPTVNFQIDLNWMAHGVSQARAAGTGLLPQFPFGYSSGHALPPFAQKAVANILGQGVHNQFYEWEGQGADISSPAIPALLVSDKANEDVAQIASWQLALNAGQIYAFHIRFRTGSEVFNAGSGPLLTNLGGANATSDFSIGDMAAAVISTPAHVRANEVTLTILDPQYYWETCNVI